MENQHHSKRRVWIGLNDQVTEHAYTWEDGTSLSDGKYDNWAPGQGPSGAVTHFIEDCVAMDFMDGGKWHDYECHAGVDPFDTVYTEFPYVCQYDLSAGGKVTPTVAATTAP